MTHYETRRMPYASSSTGAHALVQRCAVVSHAGQLVFHAFSSAREMTKVRPVRSNHKT